MKIKAGNNTENPRLKSPELSAEQDLDEVELTGKAEGLAVDVTGEIDAFNKGLEQDLAAGIDADAGETRAELAEVRKDTGKLIQEFLHRLSRILNIPVQALRKYQEHRFAKQLAKPDNPKVIETLKKKLANPDTPLEECISIYKRAARKYEWDWLEVRNILDDRIKQEIAKFLAQPDIDAALGLWDELSDAARSYSYSDQVADLLFQPLLTKVPESSGTFNVKHFLQRLNIFEKYNQDLEEKIKSNHQLAQSYKSILDFNEPILFGDTERFFKRQTRAAVLAMAVFSGSQQETIAQSWQTNHHIAWAEALTDTAAPKIAETLLSLPAIDSYNPQSDRQTLLTIEQDFPVADRVSFWEKAGNPAECNCDEAYTYLVVAKLPQSTTEQIKSLSKKQLSYISLALFAYGEAKVAEFWTDDGIVDLQEFSQGYHYGRNNPIDYIDYAKNISPTLREFISTAGGSGSGNHSKSRPERVVWDDRGFQGMPEQIQDFAQAVECVPEDQREGLFAVLSPSTYYHGLREKGGLASLEVQNFIAYTRLTQSQKKYSLRQVVENRAYFSEDTWPKINEGIKVCNELYLAVPAVSDHGESFTTLLQLYERASQPEHDPANQFWKICQERTVSYVAKADERSAFTTAQLSLNSIHQVYNFFDLSTKYFSGDQDLMADYLNLDANQRRVIEQVSAGTLVETARNAYDIASLAGIVNHFSYSFVERISDRDSVKLDAYNQLNTNQKQRWLFFNKNIAWPRDRYDQKEELFQLVADETKSAAVESFLHTTGLTGFSIEGTLAMIARPDCIGMYYYISDSNLNFELEQNVIKKLITLRDTGLPANYFLSARAKEPKSYDFAEKLLVWDTQKLVDLCIFTANTYAELPLFKVINSRPEETLENLKRYVEYSAVTRCSVIRFFDTPEQTSIDKIKTRIARTDEVCGKNYNTNIIEDRYLSDVAWERLNSNPKILKNFILGARHDFPAAGINFSDDMLLNPRIWQYSFPSSFWENEQTMQNALALTARCKDRGISLQEYVSQTGSGAGEYEEWLKAFQEKPWLFTDESLEFIKNRQLRLFSSYATLTESEWPKAMPELALYNFDWSQEVDECINNWRTGSPILSPENIRKLHGYLLAIPWSEAKQIAAGLANGERLNDVVAHQDIADLNQRTWQEARKNFYREKIKDDMPTFGEHCELSIAQWQQLSELPQTTLINLEQFSPYTDSQLQYYGRGLDRYIIVAGHANFHTVLSLYSLERFKYGLFSEPVDRVQIFCDRLTPDIVERLQNLPEKLHIQGIDVIDFIAMPQAEKIIAFSAELRKIFGNDFTMTVYDLLIMDIDQDLENLQKLQAECALPVTPENLRMLAVAATGDMQATITKVLSMLDHGYKTDFKVAASKLSELPQALRASVIIQKGPGNFGWSLLAHREVLLSSMEFTAEQVDQLICQVYRSNSERMPEIDAFTAGALLSEVNIDNVEKLHRLEKIFLYYHGDPQPLVLLAITNGEALGMLAENQWGIIPDFLKREQDFWRLLERRPVLLLNHWAERPAGFVCSDTGQFISRLQATGVTSYFIQLLDISLNSEFELTPAEQNSLVDSYISGGGDLKFLASTTEETQRKKIFESRVARIVEHWDDDKELAVATLDELATQLMLEPKYLQTVYNIAANLREDSTKMENKDLLHRAESLLIKAIVQFDPTVKQTFSDPERLGNLRNTVIQNMISYVAHILDEQGTDFTDEAQKFNRVTRLIRIKLLEIKRVFESSDSSETQKRLMFIDMYDLQACADPKLSGQSADSVRSVITQDVEEITSLSGSKNELKYLARLAETGKGPQQTRARELLQRSQETLSTADTRNRMQTDLLPVGTFSHGTPFENLAAILDSGNFTGELLGPKTKRDASGLFGTDLALVLPSLESENFVGRYTRQMNLGYGDIHILYANYSQNPKNAVREPWSVNADHQLVRSGIASTEITAIIVKNVDALATVKKDVATKGFYIPILDTEGKILFAPEEFDEMKVVYCSLASLSYPREIIDSVYQYYKGNGLSPKHRAAIDKAFATVAEQLRQNQSPEDLAVLVSYLKSNDLNNKPDIWYQDPDITFKEVKNVIKRTAVVHLRGKTKTMVFGSVRELNRHIKERTSETEVATTNEIVHNPLVEHFLMEQLPYSLFGKSFTDLDVAELEQFQKQKKQYERALVHLSWVDTKTTEVQSAAALFTEQRKQVMQRIWQETWQELELEVADDPEQKYLAEYCQKIIVPAVSGSLGRGESALGSDLDYVLYLDDRNQSPEIVDSAAVKKFINSRLSPKINAVLIKRGIRADAGLARAERLPVTTLSRISTFTIDLHKRRQDEEPTEIIDSAPLFAKDEGVVSATKRNLLVVNPNLDSLPSYILRDLEIGQDKNSFIDEYEKLFLAVASGQMMEKLKQSLQRTVVFKLYHLFFEGMQSGKISKEDAAQVPSGITEKVQFLERHGILLGSEAKLCQELLSFSYKLRFVGELYAAATTQDAMKGAHNVVMQIEDITYDDRAKLIKLLADFKRQILYK